MKEYESIFPKVESKQSLSPIILYLMGADQLYEEETGQKAVENGTRTPEAQQYVVSLFSSMDFDSPTYLSENAELLSKLSQAATRRLKNIRQSIPDASRHAHESKDESTE